MEVASTVQPHKGEPRASNEDFDQEWQRRFLIGGVQVKIRPEKLAAFLFCFLKTKSMLRMGNCVRFCFHNILFLRTERGEGFPWSVL